MFIDMKVCSSRGISSEKVLMIAGKLPDCRMSLCKGFTQGGSNADIVLADSFLKNITDDVDWTTGYEAVVSDAEGDCQISSAMIGANYIL